MSDEQAARRAARRAFVRRHHPDVGGDERAFVAGLAGFDRPAAAVGRPVVTVYRSRSVARVIARSVREARRRLRHVPARRLS